MRTSVQTAEVGEGGGGQVDCGGAAFAVARPCSPGADDDEENAGPYARLSHHHPLGAAARPTHWWRQLSEGLGLVIHGRAVRLVIAVSAAVTFTSASFLVVEPLYARHVLDRPSRSALFEAAAGTEPFWLR
jgi:hypothetical protein